uniref:Protein HGH1 C-terminal domain-containing protein n=1 Tax=Plectus sambesii TaxID=2011161 RepID=A0A914W2T6_9BILA
MSLIRLCSTKIGREYLREKGAYYVLREYHRWETDEQADRLVSGVIGVLIRFESEMCLDEGVALRDVQHEAVCSLSAAGGAVRRRLVGASRGPIKAPSSVVSAPPTRPAPLSRRRAYRAPTADEPVHFMDRRLTTGAGGSAAG